MTDVKSQRKSPKILVCDDDEMVRVLARVCLEEAGMEVVEAADGIEALSAFTREKPDLMFLDVEMPGKSGLEVCESIRMSGSGNDTPILIATGADDRESIDRGFNAGATQYKTKPINWSLLSRDIRYMLRASEALLELKAQEDRLRHLAYFDQLTNLPNRRSFTEQLNKSMLHSQHATAGVGLLIINIDHFKRINDSIGHERADELLKAIAARIRDALAGLAPVTSAFSSPEHAASAPGLSLELARPGGDEFSVIARNIESHDTLTTIGNTIVEALARPMSVENHQLVVTPSVGIAVGPDHGETPELLLKHAHAAMHAAKSGGRARLRIYDDSLEDDSAEKLRLEADLRIALESGEQLLMVYQPQVDAADGSMSGVEALVRWNHPELGPISPEKFIPIAEASGLITPLGNWILRRVNQDALAAGNHFPRNVAISINLSPLQFSQSNFVENLSKTLAELDVMFKIELELTEGVIMSDAQDNLGKLTRLKELGFDLAIDDFGTGYSSLSYLRNFPIDTLKIDRNFVWDLGTPDGDGIVKAILSLSQALGLRVVAEGVETQEQAAFLCQHGCSCIQGFLLAHPIAAEELPAANNKDYRSLLGLPPNSDATATPL